ncbi:MAG: sodium:calcium antiporter [Gemmatimonadetes bacterium]|nr:sodium:calcium antiporter [Gemmatimonadota bacterium]
MTQEILLFIGGVGVLYFGAEWLVRGSARLASSVGVSPIVVGLTVVSMGTSAPELWISVVASLGGSPDLAMGNVMGSNLANVGLVLGISAILRPLHVSTQVVTREVAVMIFITVALLPIIWDSHIARYEGFLLVTMLVFYLTYVFRTSKTNGTVVPHESGDDATKEAGGLSSWTIGSSNRHAGRCKWRIEVRSSPGWRAAVPPPSASSIRSGRMNICSTCEVNSRA